MSLDISAIRSRFPALSIHDGGTPRIYLDNPGGTQVPHSVVERMTDYLVESNANLGGAFRTSLASETVVAKAREAMADFLNAPSAAEIVFGQNMTSLTLHLSRSIGRHFGAGGEVILSRMDHDANVFPWLAMARDFGLEVEWLPFDTDTYEFDLGVLEKRLTDRTRLVCIGAASNLLGTINDVKTATRMAHEAGAWVYVDAVQAAPHTIIDVQDLDCDFLVCSAYKFFGPHQGILWGKRAVMERLEPYRVRPAPAELPDCFESGTQSHEGMAGTAAAVDYLAWLGDTMAQGVSRTSRAFRRSAAQPAFGARPHLRQRAGTMPASHRRPGADSGHTGARDHRARGNAPAGADRLVHGRRRVARIRGGVARATQHIRLERKLLCAGAGRRARHRRHRRRAACRSRALQHPGRNR